MTGHSGRAQIRLRPHHLLCMLTFAGRGHSAGFVARMTRVLRLAAQGRAVRVVAGPDDICSGNGGKAAGGHCRTLRLRGRDARAVHDLRRVGLAPAHPGALLRINGARIARARRAFASGAIRSACAGCAWKALCDRLAEQRFAGCLLPRGALTRGGGAANAPRLAAGVLPA